MKFFGALLAGATMANALDIEVCSDSLNDMGIQDVSLPDFVFAGETVHISVTHQPNRYIGKGKLHVELDVEGVKVASNTFELCNLTECDVQPHKLNKFDLSFLVPKDAPAGFNSVLKIMVNDHNGAQLSCVEASGVRMQKASQPEELRVSAGPADELSLSVHELEFLFEKWAHEHGKTFKEDELMDRMKIFAENLQRVATHNLKEGETYTMGLNAFAHLTADEFAETHFGYNREDKPRNLRNADNLFFQTDVEEAGLAEGLPDEIDWTTKGAVTPVKNQGSCGSCWAFSTTGALEGAYFLKTGKLVSFSEQELVSCDHVDQGCNGGLMDNADHFIQKAGGLCTEEDYPYISGTGRQKPCAKCSKVEGSAPKDVVDVAHEESSMEEAVAKRPVSVAIEADRLVFQFYRRGVLTGNCGANLDHGVLVVGYGTLKGTKYWKVKNSWGASYGMSGYVLIQRGKATRGGECGVLLSASYPVM